MTSMIQLIQTDESTEFLTYFPDAKYLYNKVTLAFNLLVEALEKDYKRIGIFELLLLHFFYDLFLIL